MSIASQERWIATRSAGLKRLETFLPRAGNDYASRRNYDMGAERRHNVSCLSPWLRHRLILEEEVIDAVLGIHTLSAAEKFVQEVCWRTYWKGWLEMRPSVWVDYREAVAAFTSRVARDPDLSARYTLAVSGKTGIECLDYWVRELIGTGYLHNHARMWFASIWIFTLELPWEAGADFFLRHLLDGDAASNTLSWRWVAGLHTAGKAYLATADNIARYTNGRFCPSGQLSLRAEPPGAVQAVAPQPLPAPVPPVRGLRTGLLLTEEDLSPESLILQSVRPKALAALACTRERSPLGVSGLVSDFAIAAVSDGLSRASAYFGLAAGTKLDPERLQGQLLSWCLHHELEQVVVPYVPVGVVKDVLQPALSMLAKRGLHIALIRRSWDESHWPYATHGYFRFKKTVLPGLRKWNAGAGPQTL